MGIPLVHAGDFVAVVSAPARAPENCLGSHAGQNGPAVVNQVVAGAGGLRFCLSPGPMGAEDGRLILVGIAVGTLSKQKGSKSTKTTRFIGAQPRVKSAGSIPSQTFCFETFCSVVTVVTKAGRGSAAKGGVRGRRRK